VIVVMGGRELTAASKDALNGTIEILHLKQT